MQGRSKPSVSKKISLTGLTIVNFNFSAIAFFFEFLGEVGSLELSYQAIDELVCSGCLIGFVLARLIKKNRGVSFFIRAILRRGHPQRVRINAVP
jgi:hypothetical protein